MHTKRGHLSGGAGGGRVFPDMILVHVTSGVHGLQQEYEHECV